jgi:hypothetical protein
MGQRAHDRLYFGIHDKTTYFDREGLVINNVRVMSWVPTGSLPTLTFGGAQANNIYFRTNGIDRWLIGGSSGSLFPYAHDTVNIGSADFAPSSIYAARNLIAPNVVVNVCDLSDGGVVPPEAEVGRARIYVDPADGDLKVKFGDGHVAVIAADTA